MRLGTHRGLSDGSSFPESLGNHKAGLRLPGSVCSHFVIFLEVSPILRSGLMQEAARVPSLLAIKQSLEANRNNASHTIVCIR